MEEFVPLFQAVIAFMALIGGFSFAVDLVIRPIKKDIARLEKDIKELKDGQAKILAKIS